MSPHKLVQKLREQRGLTQAEVARELGVSRPTYVALEQGKREMTLSEAGEAARLFNVSIEHIVLGKLPEQSAPHMTQATSGAEADIRISVPQEKHDKFREVLLYLLEKTAGKHNVGMTVVYKLLYFIDFDYYEKYHEQLMGLRYMRNQFGPTPVMFKALVDQMMEEESLVEVKSKFFTKDQTKFLPLKSANLALLSGQEVSMIDDVIARYGDKTATELSELTHEDMPWKAAKSGEDLNYEHAFYRPDHLSVGEYDEL